MKIIIPMAGRGSRMRPHTLTIPKPLICVGGKPIVQQLVEDIVKVCEQKIDEIAFVIGDFGKEAEKSLLKIAKDMGAKGKIYYQNEPLGTAHAILCAKESLEGNCVIAFADTLFKAEFTLDNTKDGIIWVNQINDPSAFGVIKLDEKNIITDFVEKPVTFVSDLAIIGIYYFNDGEYLRNELQYLLDNNIKDRGEFQLTNALENMKNKGAKFSPGKVKEWLDCGNKDATVYTNKQLLKYTGNNISNTSEIKKSKLIEPCFIGAKTIIKNATIGPYVSIGSNTKIENSIINNTIIQSNSTLKNLNLTNSMVGNFVQIDGSNLKKEVSIGDYTEIK